MARDRSKEILREIRNLREELSARLDRLESQASASSAASSSVPDPVSPAVPDTVVSSAQIQEDTSAGVDEGKPGTGQRPVAGAAAPTAGAVEKFSVIVKPIYDLSLARVVEDALAKTDGVEEASLRELRGDSATIDTTVLEGVSLVSSLRRKLPIAFDVVESSSDSVTIALAQPAGERTSGVAAPPGL